MKDYKRGTHSRFEIQIHLVWCTKYRKKILRGDIGHRFRDLAREICAGMKVEIVKGVVSADHVHMLVSIPPQVAVSKLVQVIKGKTSYKMQREFGSLRKEYWGQRMWARGYFACSTGNVSSEMVEAYIEGHRGEDEDFKVEDDLKSEFSLLKGGIT